jgi:hypothetical protein
VNDPLDTLGYVLAGTLIVLALLVALRWRRRERPDAAEKERRRRLHVNRIGRIVEGRVLELAEENSDSQLLLYNYKVRGVEYRAAQDISTLRDKFNLQRLAAGQPTQVKYDPHNPTNSIVLCEDWSGV